MADSSVLPGHAACSVCEAHPALHAVNLPHCSCGEAWPCREVQRVKGSIAEHCHKMLEGRRDTFVIGPHTFAAAVWREPDPTLASGVSAEWGRAVSAAVIRRILDWAENDWPMSLGDFLSGMFFGKEWDKKTPPWVLVPTVEQRMSAESLGFGHLYPTKES